MKKLLLFLCLFFLFAPIANAANSFEVEQTNFFLQASAGKELAETVILRNLTDQPITISVKWEGYSESSHTIDFAKLSTSELEIQPRGVANLQVVLTLPENLKSGDYYGQLNLLTNGSVETVNFTIRVLGELSEQIETTVYSSAKGLNLILENRGNVTTLVDTKVSLTNFFGHEVGSQTINQFGLKALEKVEKQIVTDQLLPGPYQIKIESVFGTEKTPQTKLEKIWLEPYFFWAGVFLLPILFMGSLILIRRKNV
jgi:hypothetical protein